MSTIDKDLAGDETLNPPFRTPLFAGEAPVVTEEEIVDTGVLAKYTVVGKIAATGKIVVLTPGASDGSQNVYGVLTQAVDATSADVRVGVYTAGFFNDAALVWPSNAALDTFIERKAAFSAKPGLHLGTIRL